MVRPPYSSDSFSFQLKVGTAVALTIIPDPAVLYIVARSIDRGRLAGIVSVLGIAIRSVFHIIAAAFGVSAILTQFRADEEFSMHSREGCISP
jgi:threonine/homoserine/homoserine lactone efflux protein